MMNTGCGINSIAIQMRVQYSTSTVLYGIVLWGLLVYLSDVYILHPVKVTNPDSGTVLYGTMIDQTVWNQWIHLFISRLSPSL